uniref:FAD/NAD(P)-binding domain-containing protein n=1 Tax=Percolomonas cosmopolitus TaxID=63605 RepID=A0A7S1KQ52_9EUKA|mmetsp:Transcript_4703/g.17671  ORF Transcript_4703/g.17671 Transcript_4703/m.17671 type:complete len:345 (+) Transcript_4703:100-1134(+)
MSLLRDEKACDMIRKLVSHPPYSEYISVFYEDEIESLQIYQHKGRKIIDSVRTKQGCIVPCLVLVQATGVMSNTSICKPSGLKVGIQGGILVNEHYECQSDRVNIPRHSLFAVGDAIEFPLTHPNHSQYTTIWRNWTSSREQAQDCALHSVRPVLCGKDMRSSTHRLVFSQTLRLFELYVACLGVYESDDSLDASYIWGDNQLWLMKLQFHEEKAGDEQTLHRLAGALVLGNTVKHYHIGNHLLQLIKNRCRFSQETRDQLVGNIEKFNFAHCLKELHEDDAFLERIPDPAPVRKFKNPLLKKKKKKAVKTSDQTVKKENQAEEKKHAEAVDNVTREIESKLTI